VGQFESADRSSVESTGQFPSGRQFNRNNSRALRLKKGSFDLLEIAISSRAFSSGFEIKTPAGIFSTKRVTGEILILNASAFQIARLELESFFSSTYNVIITGGGFYQFRRDWTLSRTWTCKGEGKLFSILEKKGRKFFISEHAQEIAECSKSRFSNDYEVKVFNDADLKLVMCIFIALSLLEHQSEGIPD